jgi:hypothetical protein
MISKFKDLDGLFKEIDSKLKKEISIFIIGGAALLYYKTGKGYTKDIDVICKDEGDFNIFRNTLKDYGFITKRAPLTHNKLDIWEMLVNTDYRFDLFVKTVCKGFCLSEEMTKRSEKSLKLNNLTVNICCKEDIVLFKSLSPERKNDVEDSIDLIKKGVNWNLIYDELVVQTKICENQEKAKELVYYFIERIADLERKKLKIPIKKKAIELFKSL